MTLWKSVAHAQWEGAPGAGAWRWTNVVVMLSQRRRRWANIKTALDERLLFYRIVTRLGNWNSIVTDTDVDPMLGDPWNRLKSWNSFYKNQFFSIWNHHKCLSLLFLLHLNTYVMGLWPLEIFYIFSEGKWNEMNRALGHLCAHIG